MRDYPLHRVTNGAWRAMGKLVGGRKRDKKNKKKDDDEESGEMDLARWLADGGGGGGFIKDGSYGMAARGVAGTGGWAITPAMKAFTFRKPAQVRRLDLEKGEPWM